MLTMQRRRRVRESGGTMRIAVIAESFLPAVNGVSNSVVRVVDHLVRNGHEVMVIAPGPGPDEIHGVPVIRVKAFGLPTYGDVRIGLPVARLVSALRSFRPDLVHLAAPAVLGAAGARAARLLGIPTVAVFQTDLAGFAKRYRLGVAVPLLWAWLRSIHRGADVTLAPSSAAAWTLSAHGIPRVARWTRGVDTGQFSPAHRCDELRRQLAPNGEIIVGFVGRLAKEKQVERLLPVTALPNVKVVIVGDGPERHRLERLMPKATFTGHLSGADLGRHYAAFDVFAHTGLDETFCQAVQEALASGVPVVAPAAGGPIDLVTHGHNGFLWSPEQPEMLVGAIAQLVENPLLRRTMGYAARKGVEGRTWDRVLGDLVDHYERVLDGSGVREWVAA